MCVLHILYANFGILVCESQGFSVDIYRIIRGQKNAHSFNSVFLFTAQYYHLSDHVTFKSLSFISHTCCPHQHIFFGRLFFLILLVVHLHNLLQLFLLGTIYYYYIHYLSMSFSARLFQSGCTCFRCIFSVVSLKAQK